MFVAVCDEKREERETIAAHIREYCLAEKFPCCIVQYERREELLEGILGQKFDIVFVCLNGFEGMEAAVKVHELDKGCDLVWVSDSPDFALQSYRINATHYLVKPVVGEHVTESLNRCSSISTQKKRLGWFATFFK